MEITVGTFNLNNLFSRFNFRAHVDALPEGERDVTVTYEFNEEGDYWFRTFRGRLIQPMPEAQRQALARGSRRWTWMSWRCRRPKISRR